MELEQAGDLGHLAEYQRQAHGPRRNFRMGPGVGEAPGQEIQTEHLLGIAHEARQIAEPGFRIQAGAFPRAGATRR